MERPYPISKTGPRGCFTRNAKAARYIIRIEFVPDRFADYKEDGNSLNLDVALGSMQGIESHT